MVSLLFPGTFDPPTIGHLNLIERSSSIFDKIYVAIAENSRKKESPCFSANERVQLLKTLCQPFSNVEIVIIDGLLMDYMKEKNLKVILRGIRNGAEVGHEIEVAEAHRQAAHIETVTMFSEFTVSSSLVREIGLYGGPLEKFVPLEILKEVSERLRG